MTIEPPQIVSIEFSGNTACMPTVPRFRARGFRPKAMQSIASAVMDCVSRYVLAWRLSNMLDASSCIEALEEALRQGAARDHSTPTRASQFTDADFTGVLRDHAIAISMEGRGCSVK
jgi:hypothetical protein